MLKFQIDSLEGLDEASQKLYEQKGDKYQLKVDGMPEPEDVSGLKSKVEELLKEKKDEAARRKEAEEKAEAEKRRAVEEAAKKAGDVEALEASWQEKLSKREKELLGINESLKTNINTMLVDNVATKLASEIALEGRAEILIPHIKARLAAEQREDKFVTVVRDASGKLSAATIDDLKNEFATNPVFAPVIAGRGATGGGANGNNKGGGAAGAKNKSRAEFDQLNPVEKAAFIKDGGTLSD